MSNPTLADDDDNLPSLKPRARRPFELASSAQSSAPSTPIEPQPSSSLLTATTTNPDETPSRTRSILNLTSSTLFGIYQPTGYGAEREEPSTPWGTGAETPALSSPNGSTHYFRNSIPESAFQNGPKSLQKRRMSTAAQLHHRMPRRGFKGYLLPLIARLAAMFAVGVLYGLLTTHLQDRPGIAPVKISLHREGWPYMAVWGLIGTALGEALPWLDSFWAADEDVLEDETNRVQQPQGSWIDIVRSIGAFVGIAFAIRKLPWESSLQLSLTLALANPAVWYTVDRSPAGFVLSTLVALSGTAILLITNPALIRPSPAQIIARDLGTEELVLGFFSQETVGVATWIASVLFVSSVCFGNIGRRLSPQENKL
ncbi:Hypothetical protein R9X50_00647200 [Acrodontium crateriforme]|uniref:INSIG domain-containing protein n=1 Tax=Acrodontium crateriforme TaxID=150365 RepID=A0AAQ3M9Q7_9PEZI|nr:Hypothetical protein R9X50_00647200 [Acrodontium crateriforme]